MKKTKRFCQAAIPHAHRTTAATSRRTEEPATLFDIPLPEREVGGAILKPARARYASKSNTMKAITALFIAVGLATAAHAQHVVTNPISDVLDEIMHVEDIAKTVEMINNKVQQINALTQQLQQIQAYVKAFGDPEQLLSIVGADALIDSLHTNGVGQALSDLQNVASGVEALTNNANGLYQTIGQTFTTPGGYELRARGTLSQVRREPACHDELPVRL